MRSTTGAAPINSRSRRQPTAFTLFELILVMAIITIAVGMAVSSMHNFAAGRRTSSCVDQIVSVTRWARSQAIINGSIYRLNMAPGGANSGAAYWVTVQSDDGQYRSPSVEMGQRFEVADGIRLSWNAPQQQDGQYIQFQPTGRTDPAEIMVTGADQHTTVIGCMSATELYHVLTLDEQRSFGT